MLGLKSPLLHLTKEEEFGVFFSWTLVVGCKVKTIGNNVLYYGW